MTTQKTLADALEQEVLTEMAGTFFGARKNLDNLLEEFQRLVSELRAREGYVHARVLFLRSLLLGADGERLFFSAIGLEGSPFEDGRARPTDFSWRPDRLPFALFGSARYAKAVALAYSELYKACESYTNGEYTADTRQRGRMVMTAHLQQVVRVAEFLNKRIEKINQEMSPSSVLQYARSIRSSDDMGKGAISNELGAESLDRGLTFRPIDLGALDLWKAPALPQPEACAGRIKAFCEGYYREREAELDKALRLALD